MILLNIPQQHPGDILNSRTTIKTYSILTPVQQNLIHLIALLRLQYDAVWASVNFQDDIDELNILNLAVIHWEFKLHFLIHSL